MSKHISRLAGTAGLIAVVVALPLAAWVALTRGPAERAEGAPLGSEPGAAPFVVHEWGTFLSVQGSDGVTLGGMVDSEEALPEFVRERDLGGGSRSTFLSKMETPVTYFYTDRPRTVKVRVRMPGGLLTHWYPAVLKFGTESQTGTVPDSFLDWGTLELTPDRPGLKPESLGVFRTVNNASTWPFARQTDSAYVRAANRPGVRKTGEVEKFLFYRGLETLDLPLHIAPVTLRNGENELQLVNKSDDPLTNVFVIHVDKGRIGFEAVKDVAGKATEWAPAVKASRKLDEGVPLAKKAVAAGLVKAGLYEKEALAMVNTWEQSYFRNDGLRVLYVMPRKLTDAAIPIQIEPKPDALERVMVGRIEVLSPEAENAAEKAVKNVLSKDEKTQQAGQAALARMGRLEEPVLRRVLALSGDEAVKGWITKRLEELQIRLHP
jgi:hypothetical protein